jgi:hypothetical protein
MDMSLFTNNARYFDRTAGGEFPEKHRGASTESETSSRPFSEVIDADHGEQQLSPKTNGECAERGVRKPSEGRRGGMRFETVQFSSTRMPSLDLPGKSDLTRGSD